MTHGKYRIYAPFQRANATALPRLRLVEVRMPCAPDWYTTRRYHGTYRMGRPANCNSAAVRPHAIRSRMSDLRSLGSKTISCYCARSMAVRELAPRWTSAVSDTPTADEYVTLLPESLTCSIRSSSHHSAIPALLRSGRVPCSISAQGNSRGCCESGLSCFDMRLYWGAVTLASLSLLNLRLESTGLCCVALRTSNANRTCPKLEHTGVDKRVS